MNMTFANTVFPKQPEAHTTFIEANNSAHQMDYFLVDWSTWTFTCDACSTNLVGMGSDHKMVMMRLEVGKAQQRQPKKKATRVQWNVVDVSKYKDGLDRRVANILLGEGLEETCKLVKSVMLEASANAQEVRDQSKKNGWASSTKLENLLQQ